jgi:hypothetical protein
MNPGRTKNADFFPHLLALLLSVQLLAADRCTAQEIILVQYDLTNVPDNADTAPATFVHGSISATPLHGIGGLIAFGVSGVGYLGTEWAHGAIGTQAMEITITPNPGLTIDFHALQFEFSTYFDLQVEVRTSLDNFASPILRPYLPLALGSDGPKDSTEPDNLELLPLISTSITFRWYAFKNTDRPEVVVEAAGLTNIEDIPLRFVGKVVPEPSSAALLYMAGAALLGLPRRPAGRSSNFRPARSSAPTGHF